MSKPNEQNRTASEQRRRRRPRKRRETSAQKVPKKGILGDILAEKAARGERVEREMRLTRNVSVNKSRSTVEQNAKVNSDATNRKGGMYIQGLSLSVGGDAGQIFVGPRLEVTAPGSSPVPIAVEEVPPAVSDMEVDGKDDE